MNDLDVRNAANDMFELDDNTRIFMHRDWRSFHLTKMGQRPNPAVPNTPNASMFEAWLDLNCQYYTLQVIPGWNGHFQSLDLMPQAIGVRNVATEWNWRSVDAKAWLAELLEQQMISERLHDALVRCLKPFKWGKRDQLPAKTRAQVLAKTSGQCVYCGTKLTTQPNKPNTYQADHVLPRFRGGGDDMANLVPSCRSCNLRKKAKTLVEFAGVVVASDNE